MDHNFPVPLHLILDTLKKTYAAALADPPKELEMSEEYIVGARCSIHACTAKLLIRIADAFNMDRTELFDAVGLPQTPFDFLLAAEPPDESMN